MLSPAETNKMQPVSSGYQVTRSIQGPRPQGISSSEEFDSVLTAAKAGAHWAVGRLYAELNPPLMAYLRTQVSSEAQDLSQDVWLTLARSIKGFEGGIQNLRALMFTVAQRRVADHLRKKTRRKTSPVPNEDLAHLVSLDRIESQVIDRSQAQAAAALLSKLPKAQSDALLLKVMGGLDNAEIAEILGKKPGAVRVLQHRAIARLRELFPEEE